MNAKAVVMGSINMDLFAQVDRFPAVGETLIGNHFFSTVGGKGLNQAVAIARLGYQVLMIGRVGRDSFGEQCLATLRDNNVDTRLVTEDEQAASGVALVNVDSDGRNTIVVVPGANRCLTVGDVMNAEKEISQASVLVAQLEIPMDTVEAGFEIAGRHGVRTILNPAPAASLSRELLSRTSVLTPNSGELEGLIGNTLPTAADKENACRSLLEAGVEDVVVTLGEDGVLVASERGFRRYPAVPVKAVDTTGAGDAFSGSLAAFLQEETDLHGAVLKANQLAGYSVTKPGARPSMPTREEFESFVRTL